MCLSFFQVSPVPSPVNDKSLSSPVGDEKKGKEKQNQPNPATITGKDKPKVNQNTNNTAPAPGTDTKRDSKTPKEDLKEKAKSKPDLPHGSKESCRGFDLKCHDTSSMTACVKNVDRGNLENLYVFQSFTYAHCCWIRKHRSI